MNASTWITYLEQTEIPPSISSPWREKIETNMKKKMGLIHDQEFIKRLYPSFLNDLFILYDDIFFQSNIRYFLKRVDISLQFKWNNRISRTLGQCSLKKNKTILIELSTKAFKQESKAKSLERIRAMDE